MDNIPLRMQPHLAVFQRDGESVSVHISEENKVINAWMQGDPFIITVGIYGQKCIIKLREVNLINVWEPESLEVLAADRRVEKENDKQEDLL